MAAPSATPPKPPVAQLTVPLPGMLVGWALYSIWLFLAVTPVPAAPMAEQRLFFSTESSTR